MVMFIDDDWKLNHDWYDYGTDLVLYLVSCRTRNLKTLKELSWVQSVWAEIFFM